MAKFRVHHETVNGGKDSCIVHADNPTDAANIVRKNFPGVIVRKVKVDKSANVSPRQVNYIEQNIKEVLINGSLVLSDPRPRHGFKLARVMEALTDEAEMMTDEEFVAAFINNRAY